MITDHLSPSEYISSLEMSSFMDSQSSKHLEINTSSSGSLAGIVPSPVSLLAAAERLYDLPVSSTSRPSNTHNSSMSQYGRNTAMEQLNLNMQHVLCAICGDKGTGKHYGAVSCDGCKGFFRRTIRKQSQQSYNCRYEKRCVIDKDHRNRCRYCRFQRCVDAGMQRESVQNERDTIANGHPPSMNGSSMKRSRSRMDDDDNDSDYTASTTTSPTGPKQSGTNGYSPVSPYQNGSNFGSSNNTSVKNDNDNPNANLFDVLLTAEVQCKTLRDTVITRTADQMPGLPAGVNERQVRVVYHLRSTTQVQMVNTRGAPVMMTIATLDDITESMRQQLLLMVEWAKTLPPFTQLNMNDQIALLRKYSSQHLLISIAFRSVEFMDKHGISPKEQILYLTNETWITRCVRNEHDVNMQKFSSHVTARILDELVTPMKAMNVQEFEFIALKGITFFNPNSADLTASQDVIATRQSIVEDFSRRLEQRCGSRPNESALLRMANLLLILPPLQAIAQGLVENLQMATYFGVARIDSLINELLFPEKKADGLTSPLRASNYFTERPSSANSGSGRAESGAESGAESNGANKSSRSETTAEAFGA